MPINADFVAVCSLLIVTGVAAAWYAGRLLLEGDVRSARVARAGTSPFLGRTPMEAAYATFEPVGRWLARAGISANAVTATGVALTLFAGIAAAFGLFGLAATLAAVGATADALDGVVARATTGPTTDGAVYDSAADRYMEFFLLGGLVVHFRTSLPALLFVLGALSGAFMISYVSAKAEALRVEVPRGSMRRAERAVYLILGFTLAPFAARLAPGVAWAYDAPVLAASALIAVVANVSALARLRALGQAVAAPVRKADSGLARLGRHQLGAALATATDWIVMIACVELLRLSPVPGTAIGAAAGGVVGFTLGRRWVFRAKGNVSRQALLYGMVWIVGTALNTGGEHLLLGISGNYLVARFIVATVVGVAWNYEMSRRLVFRGAST